MHQTLLHFVGELGPSCRIIVTGNPVDLHAP